MISMFKRYINVSIINGLEHISELEILTRLQHEPNGIASNLGKKYSMILFLLLFLQIETKILFIFSTNFSEMLIESS